MNKKLLRKKLALMLANLKKKRPFYTELEYLASTNQQDNQTSTTSASWIDTGIIPDDTTKMECRMAFTTLISGNGNEALCGVTGSRTGRFAWGFASLSPYTNFYFGLGSQNLTTTVTRDTNTHIFKLDAINKTWWIDSNTGSFTSSGSISNTTSIFLFGRNNSAYGHNVVNKPANANIYYCKIWKGGNLVRDMIPVLDWDMTPCMYDRVTEQLFYNQGTGDFSYGREIHPVEYLESTGTQYIDTGYAINTSTDEVSSDFQLITTTNYYWLMGEHDNGARFGIGSGDGTNLRNIAYGANTYKVNDTQVYNSKHLFNANSNGVYLDGVQVHGFESFSSTSTVFLFALNLSGNANRANGKIWGYKHKRNAILIRDFIPAIDENGVGFMFDRVSHTIYDNAGTGAGFNYPPIELEYLESSGTEYIDMGVGVKSNTVFKATFSIASTSTGRSYFGARNSSNERFQIVNSIGIGGGYYLATSVYPIANQKYEIEMHASGEMYLDGVKRNASNGTFSQVAFERNLWLFATNYYDSSVPAGASTFWKAQIFEGDNLVRDFIPCYKDGVAGMLDKVNSVFYPNAGTGTFTTGKIVEPEYE